MVTSHEAGINPKNPKNPKESKGNPNVFDDFDVLQILLFSGCWRSPGHTALLNTRDFHPRIGMG
jgi:hypothetical protein